MSTTPENSSLKKRLTSLQTCSHCVHSLQSMCHANMHLRRVEDNMQIEGTPEVILSWGALGECGVLHCSQNEQPCPTKHKILCLRAAQVPCEGNADHGWQARCCPRNTLARALITTLFLAESLPCLSSPGLE